MHENVHTKICVHSSRCTQCIHAGYHKLKLPKTFILIKYATTPHPSNQDTTVEEFCMYALSTNLIFYYLLKIPVPPEGEEEAPQQQNHTHKQPHEKWPLTNKNFNEIGQAIRVKVLCVICVKGVELVPLLEEMAVVGVCVPVSLTSQRPIQTIWRQDHCQILCHIQDGTDFNRMHFADPNKRMAESIPPPHGLLARYSDFFISLTKTYRSIHLYFKKIPLSFTEN